MARRTVAAQSTLLLPDESIGAIEARLQASGRRFVVGVDEVGRGPLAGPVVVAAVVMPLPVAAWCIGLDDSKRLTEAQRGLWNERIRASGIAFALVRVGPEEVDRRNILQASLLGMRLAVAELMAADPRLRGVTVLVDGNRPFGGLDVEERTVVRGDSRCYSIAAASVLAKVARDGEMVAEHAQYPEYGFDRNFGYPTPKHLCALRAHGVSPIHRRSFAPVAAVLAATAGVGFEGGAKSDNIVPEGST